MAEGGGRIAELRRGVAATALEVVQVQLPNVVCGRGHGHHPGAAAGGARRLQVVQEEVGQQEVAQVVHSKVLLEAVLRLPLRHHHHAGVIDQDVERDFLHLELLDKLPDRLHGRQVAI